jgi:hypothetical protein
LSSQARRYAEQFKLAELERSRTQMREHDVEADRGAEKLQAHIRGKADRDKILKSKSERVWLFEKTFEQQLDTSVPDGDFIEVKVEEHQTLEVTSCSGEGKLILEAWKPTAATTAGLVGQATSCVLKGGVLCAQREPNP